MEECIVTISDPFSEEAVIDLYLTLDKDTKNDVKILNGTPLVFTDIKLNAKILSSDKDSNYFEDDNLEIIEEYANSYIEGQINSYLYKVSKELGSDIDLFGKHAIKNFKTWDEWVDYNWLDNYKNAFFDVKVNVNVTSSYLIS